MSLRQALVDEWEQCADIYTDEIFYVNKRTGDITTSKPGVEHYLPPHYEIPLPPVPLPPDVSYTSSSESEEEDDGTGDVRIVKKPKLKKKKKRAGRGGDDDGNGSRGGTTAGSNGGLLDGTEHDADGEGDDALTASRPGTAQSNPQGDAMIPINTTAGALDWPPRRAGFRMPGMTTDGEDNSYADNVSAITKESLALVHKDLHAFSENFANGEGQYTPTLRSPRRWGSVVPAENVPHQRGPPTLESIQQRPRSQQGKGHELGQEHGHEHRHGHGTTVARVKRLPGALQHLSGWDQLKDGEESITSSTTGAISAFTYGPDSLRVGLPGFAGKPLFQEDDSKRTNVEVTDLMVKAAVAKEYMQTALYKSRAFVVPDVIMSDIGE